MAAPTPLHRADDLIVTVVTPGWPPPPLQQHQPTKGLTVNQLLHGIPFAEYRNLEGVSVTALKRLGRSPLSYHYFTTAAFDSPSLGLGRAIHSAVLEPDLYTREFAAYDGIRRGKEWDAFRQANLGLSVIKAEEAETVEAIRNAVMAHEGADRYLRAPGESEVSLQWTDSATGLACRARLDRLAEINGEMVIVDLKSCRDSSPEGFGRAFHSLGYAEQLASYQYGFEVVTGLRARVVVIAVETTAPHEVAVYTIGNEIICMGLQSYFDHIHLLAHCREVGYPAAVPNEQPLTLPVWATRSDEDLDYLEA